MSSLSVTCTTDAPPSSHYVIIHEKVICYTTVVAHGIS